MCASIRNPFRLVYYILFNSLFMILFLPLFIRFYQSCDESSAQAVFYKFHMISLVASMGRVMTSLKRAKVNYIHTIRCMKKRHKNCDFSHYMHHHHDVLGIASSAIMFDSQVS